MNLKRIGEFICQLRKEKNLTQESLAEKLIVDRGTISKWERGVYLPNPEMLLKLQEIFDVSVSEILFGERKGKENEKDINCVPIMLIEESQRKIRKIFFRSMAIIITLLISFLTYYFINNYSSMKVYRITGENNGYAINNGIGVVSKESTYFKLGKISLNSDSKEIYKTSLYYKKNNEEILICEGGLEEIDYLFMNRYGKDELFNPKDINYFITKLYLKIKFEDGETIEIPLKFQELYSNDNLISKPNDITPPKKNDLLSVIEIPEFIKDNFEYNKKTYGYILKENNIVQEFYPNVYTYFLCINSEEIAERYEYSLLDSSISYYKYLNTELNNNFTYSIEKDECIYGECDFNIINKFRKEYLEVIFDIK